MSDSTAGANPEEWRQEEWPQEEWRQEEWRQCVDWLIRVGVMAWNHRLTQPDAVVSDFARHLKDGLTLCRLANQLAPGSIKTRDIAKTPRFSRFLCVQNIRLFLQALNEKYLVPKDALFEPDRLVEGQCGEKVKGNREGLYGGYDLVCRETVLIHDKIEKKFVSS